MVWYVVKHSNVTLLLLLLLLLLLFSVSGWQHCLFEWRRDPTWHTKNVPPLLPACLPDLLHTAPSEQKTFAAHHSTSGQLDPATRSRLNYTRPLIEHRVIRETSPVRTLAWRPAILPEIFFRSFPQSLRRKYGSATATWLLIRLSRQQNLISKTQNGANHLPPCRIGQSYVLMQRRQSVWLCLVIRT
jgi:hypothetical protein